MAKEEGWIQKKLSVVWIEATTVSLCEATKDSLYLAASSLSVAFYVSLEHKYIIYSQVDDGPRIGCHPAF
jgi:hypothetical protein